MEGQCLSIDIGGYTYFREHILDRQYIPASHFTTQEWLQDSSEHGVASAITCNANNKDCSDSLAAIQTPEGKLPYGKFVMIELQ
jgi:hypothetical protein